MNFITKTLNKLFKSSNQLELNKIKPIVAQINDLEKNFINYKTQDFVKKTNELKKNVSDGRSYEDILPEAFALVREASKQVLGERHFDVQLAGGIFLHRGCVAEMKTGEGKTLVSTLPAYLNALGGKGVHIVTVNDYLAKRDSEWMGQIYKHLGLETGCITNELEDQDRERNYKKDITYATNNELGFDYLRDNMKYNIAEMVQKNRNFCIIDEVDSILIDESRTPLVISGAVEDKTTLYNSINKIIPFLKEDDFEIDEKTKTANLTDAGNDKAEKILKERNIISEGTLYDISNVAVVHHINQALRANKLFEKDRDYIVKSGSVVIVDEFTGRTMEGRRYGDGLHQAIEAKENVKVQNESQTLASITYQNYFRLYNKISGMTGTALTEAEEFGDIYNLSVFEIPTNIPVSRIDNEDEIYRTAEEKYDAIIEQIKICNEKSQPVLVGTTSIDKSEKISKKLRNNKIKHEVLNAKHHEQEAKIIANAGEPGAVTIATNMAGRGTDIQLGGNFEFNSSTKNGQENLEGLKDTITQKKDEVIKAGGLFVIGSERHESRRIDNQLRGRSGRQGDPGETKFFIRLEDDLMRIFGSEKIDSVLKSLGLKEGESIKHAWISKALERAQKKVEGRNFDMRKTLLKFDDVLNDQRKTIFEQRLELMNADNISEIANEMQYDVADEIVERYCPEKSYADQWNLQDLQDEINQYFSKKIDVNLENSEGDINQQYIKDKVYTLINENTLTEKVIIQKKRLILQNEWLCLKFWMINGKIILITLNNLGQLLV